MINRWIGIKVFEFTILRYIGFESGYRMQRTLRQQKPEKSDRDGKESEMRWDGTRRNRKREDRAELRIKAKNKVLNRKYFELDSIHWTEFYR